MIGLLRDELTTLRDGHSLVLFISIVIRFLLCDTDADLLSCVGRLVIDDCFLSVALVI